MRTSAHAICQGVDTFCRLEGIGADDKEAAIRRGNQCCFAYVPMSCASARTWPFIALRS
jgi:hypothetical protein